MSAIGIVAYDDARHRAQVVALWNEVFGYASPHNRPEISIDRKLAVRDGLFFASVAGEQVRGTAMAGYDGHRGWLYSVAVRPDCRGQGIGRALVRHAEQALAARGCVKINLQALGENTAVIPFYQALGYTIEPRISFGKRLLVEPPRA